MNLKTEINENNKNNKIKKKRIIQRGQTSTWNIKEIKENNYQTENNEKYLNPFEKIKKEKERKEGKEQKEGKEGNYYHQQRNYLQENIIEKFEKLINERYGTIERLLSTFQRKSDDKITLDEFTENLRKRNLDVYFPRDQQRLLFEKYDRDHLLVIPMKELLFDRRLTQNNNNNNNNTPNNNDNLKNSKIDNFQFHTQLNDMIRMKLSNQILPSRIVNHPHHVKLELLRSFRQHDPNNSGYITPNNLINVVNSTNLNLKLTSQDIQKNLDLTQNELSTCNIDYVNFVKNLDLHQPDYIGTPFFDSRSKQITRLKFRAKELEGKCKDPELLKQRDQLIESSKNSIIISQKDKPSSYQINSIKTSLNPSILLEQLKTPILQSNEIKKIDTNCNNQNSNTDDIINNQNNSNINQLEKIEQVIYPPNRSITSVISKSPVKRVYKPLVNDSTLLSPTLTLTSTLTSPTIMSPSIPKSNNIDSPTTFISLKANIPNQELLDGSLTSRSLPDDLSRPISIHSEYYTPLQYTPSKPVTRPGVISDAQRESMKRAEIRHQRYLRTQNNLQKYQNNKNLEDINHTLLECSKASHHLNDSLVYELQAYERDMVQYYRKPGTYAQKKLNPSQSRKIWGGSIDLSNQIEDRDFITTQFQSYSK